MSKLFFPFSSPSSRLHQSRLLSLFFFLLSLSFHPHLKTNYCCSVSVSFYSTGLIFFSSLPSLPLTFCLPFPFPPLKSFDSFSFHLISPPLSPFCASPALHLFSSPLPFKVINYFCPMCCPLSVL